MVFVCYDRHLLVKNCYKADILEQLLAINLSYIQTVFTLDSGPAGKDLVSRVDKLDPQHSEFCRHDH